MDRIGPNARYKITIIYVPSRGYRYQVSYETLEGRVGGALPIASGFADTREGAYDRVTTILRQAASEGR